MTHDTQLDLVLRALKGSGVPLTVLRSAPDLALQIGDDENAVMAIALRDPARPSFDVSYPAVRRKRSGDRRVDTVHSSGVLVPAIVWIARQLLEHGSVHPEHE
jgi:hypothetical protein